MKLRLLFITHYCANVFGFVTGLVKLATTTTTTTIQKYSNFSQFCVAIPWLS